MFEPRRVFLDGKFNIIGDTKVQSIINGSVGSGEGLDFDMEWDRGRCLGGR